MFLPKELYLILPKGPGLILRQHAEVSSFHIYIHGLREINVKAGITHFDYEGVRHDQKKLPAQFRYTVLYLGPAALLAQQVCVEVGHFPRSLIGETPHQLPVAHVVELLPCLLGLAAVFKERHRLVEE